MKKIFLLSMALAASLASTAAAPHVKTDIKRMPGQQYTTHNAASEVILENPTANHQTALLKAQARREAQLCTITLVEDPDKDGNISNNMEVIFYDKQGIDWRAFMESTMEIPQGEYVMMAFFYADNIMICRDGINIEGNTTIHICRDEATNTLSAQPLMRDGNPLKLPTLNADLKPVNEDYNAMSISGTSFLSYKGYIPSANLLTLEDMRQVDKELRFKTNVTTSDISAVWALQIYERDYTASLNYYIEVKGDTPQEEMPVKNDVSKFREMSVNIINTPIYKEMGNGNKGLGAEFNLYDSKSIPVAGTITYSYDPIKIYTCNYASDSEGFYSLSALSSIDIAGEDMLPSGIMTPGIAVYPETELFCSTQAMNNYAFSGTRQTGYPINEFFSYNPYPGMEFGNSAATIVTCVNVMDYLDPPASLITPTNVYGNGGEIRNSDANTIGIKVMSGDETLLESPQLWSVYEWAMERAANNEPSIPLTYIFTDPNIEVDGIAGSTVCEVSVVADGEDCTPPTLQRIMFRDKDMLHPQIKFSNPEDGTITIAGGDFTRSVVSYPSQWGDLTSERYEYAPAKITVEYAPFGSDSFEEIAVTENPGKFFMPGYGAYWQGSLAGVNRTSADGWFDLRVTLTDASGNYQSQVLSPAFRIESAAGIESIDLEDPHNITIVDGEIISSGNVEVFDMSGRRVSNSPGSGIYVVRHGDYTTKVVL